MKNKLKFAAMFMAILVVTSSFCFAEDQTPIEPRTTDVEQINITDEEAVTTNLENDTITTDVESEFIEEEPEIYEGDLYIFDDTVNMNKLVDGNVYIIGKDVNITGQIAGNLFVIADNLTIGDTTSVSSYNGYVFYNIYALANKATLYSSCYDLYIAGNDISIEDSFYLYRDLIIGAKNADIYSIIGRNVNAKVGNLNLKKDDSLYASIYGKLNYTSPVEIDTEISSLCVNGEISYINDKPILSTFSKIKIAFFFVVLFAILVFVLIITFILRIILFIIRMFQKSNAKKADTNTNATSTETKKQNDNEVKKEQEPQNNDELKNEEEIKSDDELQNEEKSENNDESKNEEEIKNEETDK